MEVPFQADRKTDWYWQTLIDSMSMADRHISSCTTYFYLLRWLISWFFKRILKVKSKFWVLGTTFSPKVLVVCHNFSTQSWTVLSPNYNTPCVKGCPPYLVSYLYLSLKGRKGYGMVDVKKPCKTDANSPALYKGLLLGTVFVSPLISCICHFTPGEREWEAVERYKRRERERGKSVI